MRHARDKYVVGWVVWFVFLWAMLGLTGVVQGQGWPTDPLAPCILRPASDAGRDSVVLDSAGVRVVMEWSSPGSMVMGAPQMWCPAGVFRLQFPRDTVWLHEDRAFFRSRILPGVVTVRDTLDPNRTEGGWRAAVARYAPEFVGGHQVPACAPFGPQRGDTVAAGPRLVARRLTDPPAETWVVDRAGICLGIVRRVSTTSRPWQLVRGGAPSSARPVPTVRFANVKSAALGLSARVP
jgi:hypothetical protein